ncbi:MAG: response regulator transcription factor [Methylovirgula sp.]
MTRILVVEDEPALHTDLVDYLTMRGFMAEGVATAAELRAAATVQEPPAIVILDIGLPDGSGFDLAIEIRRSFDCGILMLTALGETNDRVRGFDSGADIYLVKHSSLREIEAAVRSLLRRLQDSNAESANDTREQWVLDRKSWSLITPDRNAVRLTATELVFVSALMEKNGQPCPREELSEALAKPQTSWDNRHLDAVVNRLRRKIRESASVDVPIRMVYSRGYTFSASSRIVD